LKLVSSSESTVPPFVASPLQPFAVAEVFTGIEGRLVPLKETVQSFKAILAGKYDHLPENAFYMCVLGLRPRPPRPPPPCSADPGSSSYCRVGDTKDVEAKAAKLAAELEAGN